MPNFQMIPTASLRLSEDNARQDGPGDVAELVASIKEHGVLVPLHVIARTGCFDVIDGQRRMTAALAAEVDEVPAMVYLEGEIDRSAEIGVAINVVRQQLSAINIAKAAGHVMRQAGLKLDDVGALAIVKKGADKLRKMPAIQQAAAGCGIDVDTFITYGAVSSLEQPWWDALAKNRTRIGTMGLALGFSKEERERVIAKAGENGWIDNQMLWAEREIEASAVDLKNALFRRTAGIDEGSDLFGGTGRVVPGSIKTFFERQEAAVAELAAMLKKQFDVDVTVAVGRESGSRLDPRYIVRKDLESAEALEAAIFPEWAGDRSKWTIHGILTNPITGRVVVMVQRARDADKTSASGRELRADKALLEQLDTWLRVVLTRTVLAKPEPFLRFATMCLQHWQVASRAEELFHIRHGMAYPFAKNAGRTVNEIEAAAGNQLRAALALALLGRVAGRADKGNGWTPGLRHLLFLYDLDPQRDLGSLVPFLSKLPGSWLEERCREKGLAVGSRGKMASALADKLEGDWWPAWLDEFRPKELDITGRDEEDDEQVDPAAQPDVHAAHAGDTPRGPAAEDDAAGDDEGDDFDAPPRR